MNENVASREEINAWLQHADIRPIPLGNSQTFYPYILRFIIYDVDGTMLSSNDKRFRFRKDVEAWASKMRKEHTRLGIISSITIIKTETNAVISQIKSDKLKKIQRAMAKTKVLKTY